MVEMHRMAVISFKYLLHSWGLVENLYFPRFQVHLPASGNRAACFGRDQRTVEPTPDVRQRLPESAARHGGGLWIQ